MATSTFDEFDELYDMFDEGYDEYYGCGNPDCRICYSDEEDFQHDHLPEGSS